MHLQEKGAISLLITSSLIGFYHNINRKLFGKDMNSKYYSYPMLLKEDEWFA